MQRRISRFLKFLAAFCTVFLNGNLLVADTTYLPPVPPKENKQSIRNLAPLTSGTHFLKGTTDGKWIPPEQSNDASGDSVVLNPEPTAKVDPGKQEFLFEFSDLEKVNRMAFQQKGKGGVVKVFSADAPYPADSNRWKNVNDTAVTGTESIVNMEFPVTSMRYMKMTVEYPDGGELSSFLLSGDSFIEDNSEMVPPPEEWPTSTERIDYDFARSAAGGQVTHVASGIPEESYNITDGDPTTYHEFEPSPDGVYFNVALAEDYPVHETSIMTDQAIGSVEVWTFITLPDELLSEETGDGQARGLNVSQEFIANRQANGRIQVPVDEDVTELTIPLPDTAARYILVKVVAKYPDEPIRVRHFTAKGRVPRELLGLPGDSRAAAPRANVEQSNQDSGPESNPTDDFDFELPRIPIASP